MSTTDADGHTTGRLYDGAGDLTGIVDPSGNRTQYLYDDQGRPTGTIDPLGHASVSDYDEAGNVTLSVDPLGRKIATSYDADNRVVSETWTNADGSSAGGKTFTYDAAGDLLTASNGVGTYTFTYDGAGRVGTVADPFGVTLTMGYDGGGNRTSVTDGSGGTTTSTFDPAGNLATRSLSASGADATVTFGHDAAGRETGRSWTSGGASVGSTGTSYDGAGDVTGVTGTASGVLVFGQTSGFDGAGRLSSTTTGGVTTTFGYDPAGQLTSAGAAGYSYDPNGVPTSGGLTPGADNQVASDGTWDYTYDAAGELVAKVLIAGGTSWGYGYDPAGELTSAVETVSGSVAVEVDYQYDAFGDLVGRTETDSGTVVSDVRYAVDGWDTAKPSPTGNENYDVYAVLTPNGSGGWAISERQVFGAGFDQPLAGISASGVVQWYVADRQGSVVGVFGNSGTTLATATYDAFGNTVSGGVSGVTLYGFQGGEYDPATGYVNFGGGAGRWYDPGIEQWIKKDPLGLTPGPNASAFERNGPGNGVDPSGRWLYISPDDTDWAFWGKFAAQKKVTLTQLGQSKYRVDPLDRSPETHAAIAAALGQMGVGEPMLAQAMNALYGGNLSKPINPDGDLGGLNVYLSFLDNGYLFGTQADVGEIGENSAEKPYNPLTTNTCMVCHGRMNADGTVNFDGMSEAERLSVARFLGTTETDPDILERKTGRISAFGPTEFFKGTGEGAWYTIRHPWGVITEPAGMLYNFAFDPEAAREQVRASGEAMILQPGRYLGNQFGSSVASAGLTRGGLALYSRLRAGGPSVTPPKPGARLELEALDSRMNAVQRGPSTPGSSSTGSITIQDKIIALDPAARAATTTGGASLPTVTTVSPAVVAGVAGAGAATVSGSGTTSGALEIRSDADRVIGYFTRGESLEIVSKSKRLYGGNVIKLQPNVTTTILGTMADTGTVRQRGVMPDKSFNGATKQGANPGGINSLFSPVWDELKATHKPLLDAGDEQGYWKIVTDTFWNDINKPWLEQAIDRGDTFRLVSDPNDEFATYSTRKTGGRTEFVRDAAGNKVRSIYGREVDYLKSRGFRFNSDGTVTNP